MGKGMRGGGELAKTGGNKGKGCIFVGVFFFSVKILRLLIVCYFLCCNILKTFLRGDRVWKELLLDPRRWPTSCAYGLDVMPIMPALGRTRSSSRLPGFEWTPYDSIVAMLMTRGPICAHHAAAKEGRRA